MEFSDVKQQNSREAKYQCNQCPKEKWKRETFLGTLLPDWSTVWMDATTVCSHLCLDVTRCSVLLWRSRTTKWSSVLTQHSCTVVYALQHSFGHVLCDDVDCSAHVMTLLSCDWTVFSAQHCSDSVLVWINDWSTTSSVKIGWWDWSTELSDWRI